MLPAVPGWGKPPCSPRIPETPRVAVLFESEAEDWAQYLQTLLQREWGPWASWLYPLASWAPRDLAGLGDCPCRLLVLSGGLLRGLDPPKGRFLRALLRPPGTPVTLLCGVPSTAPLFHALQLPPTCWELSTAQEPQEYLAVLREALRTGKRRDSPRGDA
ncbi:B-cell scaffold protein with ankyrin repeats, partial [Erinaceus europaeus]|uniref:B-cell scaffold protein with ankyrin repeats n=1 Tax=Erinaceus europaeus TaxID=9365 RepID=A0ABM3VVQ1_ERIEU